MRGAVMDREALERELAEQVGGVVSDKPFEPWELVAQSGPPPWFERLGIAQDLGARLYFRSPDAPHHPVGMAITGGAGLIGQVLAFSPLFALRLKAYAPWSALIIARGQARRIRGRFKSSPEDKEGRNS